MGYSNIKVIKAVTSIPLIWNTVRMCELGNQRIRNLENTIGIRNETPAGNMYRLFVSDYTCIDLNGEDGAEVLDLSKPITSHDFEFDLVTNMGTSEHVEDFCMCLMNIDRMCKRYGFMVHTIPMTGNFQGHGSHYVAQDFFIRLACLLNYDLINVFEAESTSSPKPNIMLCGVVRKLNNQIPEQEHFRNIAKYIKNA